MYRTEHRIQFKNFKMFIQVILVIGLFAKLNVALWCFECSSSTPGCGDDFNWWMHWTRTCPDDDDVCVKIIDQHMGQKIITRSCLSSIGSIRRDIPADRYEGCRPGPVDIKLANYVNHSIPEHDVQRNRFNSTWCFCYFDHSCNSSNMFYSSISLILSTILIKCFI